MTTKKELRARIAELERYRDYQDRVGNALLDRADKAETTTSGVMASLRDHNTAVAKVDALAAQWALSGNSVYRKAAKALTEAIYPPADVVEEPPVAS